MPAPDASPGVCAMQSCSADRMAAAILARHGVCMTQNPSLECARPIDNHDDRMRTRVAPTGLPALMRDLEPRRGARLGSLVEVVDRAGRATRYELVGRAPGPSPVAV